MTTSNEILELEVFEAICEEKPLEQLIDEVAMVHGIETTIDELRSIEQALRRAA